MIVAEFANVDCPFSRHVRYFRLFSGLATKRYSSSAERPEGLGRSHVACQSGGNCTANESVRSSTLTVQLLKIRSNLHSKLQLERLLPVLTLLVVVVAKTPLLDKPWWSKITLSLTSIQPSHMPMPVTYP
jgi:hypothetical protein